MIFTRLCVCNELNKYCADAQGLWCCSSRGVGILMKKGFLALFFFILISLAGCQKESDTFLAYDKSMSASGESIDNRVAEADFFADDIAVVSKEQNTGGDEKLNSGAVLLVNITDKQTIYADHVYDKMYPASLTKLLTSLVILRSGELTDMVTVDYNASHIKEGGARVCGYEEGDVLSLEALLNSLLIYSANDAAIAAADHVGGSEEGFVAMMNDEARKIGAVNSNFVNPHGLHDDNQYTTAYDMYLIFNELLKYDTFRSIISTNSYTAVYKDQEGNEKQKTLNTSNLYLSGEAEPDQGVTVVGGLTGTTSKAGNCMILLCRDNSGKEYVAILLNASDTEALYSQMTYLLSFTATK